MLHVPRNGSTTIEHNHTGTTSVEFGVSVAAAGSSHVKNTTYTTLIAATTYTAYGITVMLAGTATAVTATAMLVDIAIGAAAAEQVIIPNLIAGSAAAAIDSTGPGHAYFFPIVIPAGVRLSATAQALIASDTCFVGVYLHQHQVPGKWYGQRVTAYGVNTAASAGTSMSPGNNSYATDVSLSASTAAPIKYLQMGHDLLADTVGGNNRGQVRITAGTAVLVEGLVYNESTVIERVNFNIPNLILSHMMFNVPAASSLLISARRNTTAAARSWALYGVD